MSGHEVAEAEPHIRAVMDLLRGGVPPVLTVELAVAPVSGAPFAVVYPDAGAAEYNRLCASRSDITIRFMVHAVGVGPEQATWVFDNVRRLMLGPVLEVPGRVCFPMTQTLGPSPVRRDQTVQPPLYLQVAEFRLWSQAA